MAKKTSAASASEEAKKRRVILYCGTDPAKRENSFFYLNLVWKMTMLGRERGIEILPIMDSRPVDVLDMMPVEVSRILENKGAEGIVGIMLYESMTAWMEDSGLPYSALFSGSQANRVDFDYRQMIELAFARLGKQGCRSVGLMIPSHLATSPLLERMDECASASGLKVNYEWVLVSRQSQELNGYNHFCSLWDLKGRPDGLVVFPDVTARGVVTAIVEKNVRVPEDLKLILHRNEEGGYSVPVRCDWLENSGAMMAQALIGVVENQWEGKALKKLLVPFKLVHGEKP